MDTDAIDRAGIEPLRGDVEDILAIADYEGVARRMAHPMSHAIVGSYVFLDETNTRHSLVHLDQQRLGS